MDGVTNYLQAVSLVVCSKAYVSIFCQIDSAHLLNVIPQTGGLNVEITVVGMGQNTVTTVSQILES